MAAFDWQRIPKFANINCGKTNGAMSLTGNIRFASKDVLTNIPIIVETTTITGVTPNLRPHAFLLLPPVILSPL